MTKKLRTELPYQLPTERKVEIMKALFPEKPNRLNAGATVNDVEPLNIKELLEATEGMKPGKAPGLGGVPTAVIKEVARNKSRWLLDMMNQLLKTQKLPNEWKIAKTVLVLKVS